MNGIVTNGWVLGLVLLAKVCLAQDAFTDLVLKDPNNHKSYFDSVFTQSDLPIYSFKKEPYHLLLENGYASYQFQNPEVWPPQGADIIPTHVKVVFTKYPKDRAFWLTDYQWLLSKRLQALFKLDSSFNQKDVTYSMVLQTDCDNEFEAMQLFHGIEVTYKKLEKQHPTQKETEAFDDALEKGEKSTISEKTEAEKRNNSQIKRIKRLMYQEKFDTDSTVFNVLDRNNQWQNAAIVMDWTGSVYGFGAEAMLWHAMHEDSSGIEYCTLFNDGNRTKNRKKIIGYTGGVYFQDAKPVSRVVKQFKRVQNKGKGGDSPENDVEALITSIQEFPKAESFILIADNYSCMRDFVLTRHVKKPIHIILVGKNEYINPQYLNLAWRTGGSIHTKDMDLTNINELVRTNSLVINGIKYTLTKNNQLMPENRSDYKFNYCNKYYVYPKRKQKAAKRRKDPECYFTK
jgi:hypothetical protein